jgi:F0F1-type ATP synthase epsilon subunit
MLHVSIVTPEGVAYDDVVTQITVPTESGEVTI